MVVPDTQTEADHAVELIAAFFDSLPAVTDACTVVVDGAPQLYGCYKNNVVFDWHAGNHTGVDTGFAKALFEHAVYDDEGQILSASIQDFAMPPADHFPLSGTHMQNTPCKNNILGIKHSGEAGAIGATFMRLA